MRLALCVLASLLAGFVGGLAAQYRYTVLEPMQQPVEPMPRWYWRGQGSGNVVTPDWFVTASRRN